MATGLKLPVGVNKSGGAAIQQNSQAQLLKVFGIALSEGGDQNPFQNLGISSNLVFQIQSRDFNSKAEREIERVLQGFTDRLELAPDEPFVFSQEREGETILTVRLFDIEQNESVDFKQRFVSI